MINYTLIGYLPYV